MTNQHPITPPPELVQQWIDANRTWLRGIALEAAQWGADQELEACCEWLSNEILCESNVHRFLRAARRKAPTLKEQALDVLETLFQRSFAVGEAERDTIRRALEQLDD